MGFKLSLSVGCALAILLFSLSISSVSAKGGKGKGKQMNFTCKGEPIDMKKMKMGMRECSQEMNKGSSTPSTTSEESQDDSSADAESSDGVTITIAKEGEGGKKGKGKWGKNTCTAVCSMKKNKILGDDGTYNSDGANDYIKSVYPASVQDAIKTIYDDCAKNNGDSFSMDNNCEGYKKFKGCTTKKSAEACGFDMSKMKKKHGKGKGKNKGGDEDGMTSSTMASSEEQN